MSKQSRTILVYNIITKKFLVGFNPLTYKPIWTDNVERAKIYTSEVSANKAINNLPYIIENKQVKALTLSNNYSNSLNLKSF